VYALGQGFNIGVTDFIVPDIAPNPIYDGSSSHTYGINLGIFIERNLTESIVAGASADFYLEHDEDKLDPDHHPLWYKLQFYSFGPIYKVNKNTDFKWHIDLRLKENTVSGIERELKNFFGVGINSDTESTHLALKFYAGFFYLEFDDDVPAAYAGYERRDLDDGTPALSEVLEGSIKLSDKFTFLGSATYWGKTEEEGDWLEKEFMVEINYASDDWIKHSTVHFSVLQTEYNLAVHYRETLGKPILPWNKDILVRLYVSMPWGSN